MEIFVGHIAGEKCIVRSCHKVPIAPQSRRN